MADSRPGRSRSLARMPLFAALACGLGAGCSHVVECSNAGIAALEREPFPCGPFSRGAKYAGWIVAAPAVVALTPVAALAWATPWVDLPTAVDIQSAPAVGLGYGFEAMVGPPFWAVGRLAGARAPPEPGPDASIGVPCAVVPWGFVAGHSPCAAAPRAPEPVPSDVDEYYAVPADDVRRLSEQIAAEEARTGRARHLSLPIDLGVPSVLDIYLASTEEGGRRPLVLMTPPLEVSFATRYLARRLARRGVHAAVVTPEDVFIEPELCPPQLEAKLRRAVVTARAVLRVLSRRDDVDSSRSSYLGVSAGGIFGAILLALEPSIARAALVLPGGDLPRIIGESTEPRIREYREAWAARGVGGEALVAELRREVRTDPLLLARHVDPRRVLLFIGSCDTSVPTQTGLDLRRALGDPEVYLLSGGHVTSCLCFGFILRRIEEFLRDPVQGGAIRMSPPAPGSPAVARTVLDGHSPRRASCGRLFSTGGPLDSSSPGCGGGRGGSPGLSQGIPESMQRHPWTARSRKSSRPGNRGLCRPPRGGFLWSWSVRLGPFVLAHQLEMPRRSPS